MTALTKVQKLEAELEAARAEEAKQASSKDDFEGLVVKFNELGASINAMLLSRTSTDNKDLVSVVSVELPFVITHSLIRRLTFKSRRNSHTIIETMASMLQNCLRTFYIIIAVQVNKRAEKKNENDTPVTLDMDLLRLTSTFTAEVLTSSGSA